LLSAFAIDSRSPSSLAFDGNSQHTICPPDILMYLDCGIRGFQPKLDYSQTLRFVT
jgi:hypothetical protein